MKIFNVAFNLCAAFGFFMFAYDLYGYLDGRPLDTITVWLLIAFTGIYGLKCIADSLLAAME